MTTDDSQYERDVARAREEGTDFVELENDLPEPDRYGAAKDLARLLSERGENWAELAGEVGLPGEDPALWEALDIARAASYARAKYREAFAGVVVSHPWLEAAADSSAHDAIGSMADRFMGQ